MGKVKHKKYRAKKQNPVGVPQVQKEIDLSEVSPSGKIQHILDLVLTGKPNNREFGVSLLCNVVTQNDPQVIEEILQQKVVKIVAPFLVDQDLSLRLMTAGALRNLSVSGVDICSSMVDQDVLTPLTLLLKKYTPDWDKDKDKSTLDSERRIFVEVVHLLLNLCEGSDTAVSVFNNQRILLVLLSALDVDKHGLDVVVSVAQCLHTVTENNPDVVELLQSENVASTLHKLLELPGDEANFVLLRTVIAGVLLNIRSSDFDLKNISNILTVLAATLSIDPDGMIQKLLDKMATSTEPEELDQNSITPAVEKEVAAVEQLLTSQLVALEILANICCTDDDDEDSDLESSDNSDDIDGGNSMNWESSEEPVSFCVSPEIEALLVENKFVELSLKKVDLSANQICSKMSQNDYKDRILKKLNLLRCRSLLCLNNLVSCMSIEDLGGSAVLYETWKNIGILAFKNTDASNVELLEALTSAMRAILQKLAEISSSHFEQITLQDLQMFSTSCQKCPDAGVRVNLIRIVGVLGVLMAASQKSELTDLLKFITGWLCDTAVKDTEVWVMAEALDSLIDMFSEDYTDNLAVEMALVDRMKAIQGVFRQKLHQHSRNTGKSEVIVSTVRSNLTRFIKYKSRRFAAQQVNGNVQ